MRSSFPTAAHRQRLSCWLTPLAIERQPATLSSKVLVLLVAARSVESTLQPDGCPHTSAEFPALGKLFGIGRFRLGMACDSLSEQSVGREADDTIRAPALLRGGPDGAGGDAPPQPATRRIARNRPAAYRQRSVILTDVRARRRCPCDRDMHTYSPAPSTGTIAPRSV
jgi:hypothetical protein